MMARLDAAVHAKVDPETAMWNPWSSVALRTRNSMNHRGQGSQFILADALRANLNELIDF